MRKALATVQVGLFAFAAFSSGMDRLSASVPGLERVVPKYFRAEAARSASAIYVLRGDLDKAHGEAMQAVRHDPVDPHSAALLATVRLEKGDLPGAYAAYRTAALFGWRDQSTQVYWYGQALDLRDWDVAMDRADAIMRTTPSLPAADEILSPFELDPDGRASLARHVFARPDWIEKYLDPADTAPDELWTRRVRLLTEMGKAGSKLGCKEVLDFTKGLLERNRRREAEQVWNQHCTDHPVEGLVADPRLRFIDQQSTTPFGWVVRRNGNVSVDQRGEGDTARLALGNSASSVQMALYQPVSLEPGTYEISADHAGSLDEGDLLFSFACAGPLPFPQPGPGDISRSSQTFTVGNCEKQTLGIWVGSNTRNVELRGIGLRRVGGP